MKYTKEYWNDVEDVVTHIPNVNILYSFKLLITGATGMICSAVAEIIFYLNKQYNAEITLYLAGRSRKRMSERFAEFIEGQDYYFIAYDATREVKLDLKVDYIIHGASNANPSVYSKEPVETVLGNIIGLNSLLQLAVKKRIKRLLYISSSEVYGNKTENCQYVEDNYGFVDILNPRACYPSAKRTAETLCISYSVEYNVDSVIVRPGHIYGPTITLSDNRASAQFIRNVVNGEDIIMKSTGGQLRSYCYTLDCASAIISVLINGKNCNAYNISNKNSIVSIRELAEELADCSNSKIVFENPTDAEEMSYNLMSNSSLNANKLEALGWSACFDLKDGVRRTINTLCNM